MGTCIPDFKPRFRTTISIFGIEIPFFSFFPSIDAVSRLLEHLYECEKYIRLLLFKKLQSWRGWFRYLFFIIEIRFVNTSWKLINNSFSSEILLFIRFDGYHAYTYTFYMIISTITFIVNRRGRDLWVEIKFSFSSSILFTKIIKVESGWLIRRVDGDTYAITLWRGNEW